MNILLAILLTFCCLTTANAQQSKILMNNNWTFHLGNAASPEKDFAHGTEYFTYYAKVIGENKGPVNEKFDDSSWQHVSLPHDWVVDLPYSSVASHSHGYKQVGCKYPQNSVGWYRKHFNIAKEDEGKLITIQFDGIFRNAQIFCNGFYLGHELSGYATQTYNLSECLNYGGDNIIVVRCDASTEEGWYYEGGGIYRNVWLIKRDAAHHINKVAYVYKDNRLKIKVDATDECRNTLLDESGNVVAEGTDELKIGRPHLWNVNAPYLYTLKTTTVGGEDEVLTKVGLRTVAFDVRKGFLLNGDSLKLKGANLHLDHAGVGVGVPDELWVYKIKKLKDLGMNAIRCSHNPATPAMLDVCDSLGVLVIDENRQMGTNDEQLSLFRRMIERDRNHPSVILWSIGNEEWWIEGSEKGEKIARKMIDFARTTDDSRPYTYGNSGGFALTKQVDVQGYNYIIQNDVDRRHAEHPEFFVIGTEETSGCGTRNVYETDSVNGWMKSINMAGENRAGHEKNVIERGWKYYRDHTWTGGLFYWTGFDYRGEPNPMKWPATGSQFGILDYCGFPKDEAYYLKSAWTDESVLHVFPHLNMKGKEGQSIEIWAYSNMDEVEIVQNGKSLGRQSMPKDGHLVWKTVYNPGRIVAYGYKKGKKTITQKIETTDEASLISLQTSKRTLRNDGQDIVVIDLTLKDKKNRYVPDACENIRINVSGQAEILGWGNGDPGYKTAERPLNGNSQIAEIRSFMGHAQVILRSIYVDKTSSSPIVFTANIEGGKSEKVEIRRQ